MSGKRNNFVDSVIVEFERTGLLRSYERKLDSSPGLARAVFQDQLDTSKDQFLGWSAFAGGAAFQPSIDRIWNVNGRTHGLIVPYLWLGRKVFQASIMKARCFAKPARYAISGTRWQWTISKQCRGTIAFAIDDLEGQKSVPTRARLSHTDEKGRLRKTSDTSVNLREPGPKESPSQRQSPGLANLLRQCRR